MKDTPSYREHLVNLLKTEITSASNLLQLLKSERADITSFNNEKIHINSSKKEALISLLQDASNCRINYMTLHDITNPIILNENNSNNASSGTSGSELSVLFENLTVIARECYDENRIIGQLINRHSQFISKTIASLSPQSATNSSESVSGFIPAQTLTYEENGNFVNT